MRDYAPERVLKLADVLALRREPCTQFVGEPEHSWLARLALARLKSQPAVVEIDVLPCARFTFAVRPPPRDIRDANQRAQVRRRMLEHRFNLVMHEKPFSRVID